MPYCNVSMSLPEQLSYSTRSPRAGTTTYPVIRLEVIDLFAEYQRPQVLADELDDIERIIEPRPVSREPN